MNFDLLSQNLLLVVCAALSAMALFIIMQLLETAPVSKKRGRKPKNPVKPPHGYRFLSVLHMLEHIGFFNTIAWSIVAALLLQVIAAHYADSKLPNSIILMIFPATVSVGIFILSLRLHKKLMVIGALYIVFSVLFSLLLVNNYYRFYPTLGQVFGKNNVASLNGAHQNILIQYGNTDPTRLSTQSTEGALNTIATQPTGGKIYGLDIPGTTSGFKPRGAFVYVPAVYSNPIKVKLPVLVLTAGFPGSPENWLGAGLQTIMDGFAKTHHGITPLVFVVDNTGSLTNDTECVDGPRGNVETYLANDVPAYIKDHFNVQTDASHWAIGGLSLGGLCSIMLTLRHPNVYQTFIDLGGEIGPEVGPKDKTVGQLFAGSEAEWQAHQPEYLLATRHYGNYIGGFFGVGKQDEKNVVDAASQLSTDAQKAGIETVYETIDGEHTFNVWSEAFKLALPWASNRVGATECNNACL